MTSSKRNDVWGRSKKTITTISPPSNVCFVLSEKKLSVFADGGVAFQFDRFKIMTENIF